MSGPILPADIVTASQAWETLVFPTANVHNANLFVSYPYVPTADDNPKYPYAAHRVVKFHGDSLSLNQVGQVEYGYTLQMYTVIVFANQDEAIGILDERLTLWIGAYTLGFLEYIDLGIVPNGQAVRVIAQMGDPEAVNLQLSHTRTDAGMQVLNTIDVRQTLSVGR